MKRLIIIGASGHGKVVADVAKHTYDTIVFLDNDSDIKECAGYPVIGPDTMVKELKGDVFIAVGNHSECHPLTYTGNSMGRHSFEIS